MGSAQSIYLGLNSLISVKSVFFRKRVHCMAITKNIRAINSDEKAKTLNHMCKVITFYRMFHLLVTSPKNPSLTQT